MKSTTNLNVISGGIATYPGSSSDVSPVIHVTSPGPISGLGYPATYNGKTFFGDESLTFSGIPLTIASEDRTWGEVGLAAGGGIGAALGVTAIVGTAMYLICGRNTGPDYA